MTPWYVATEQFNPVAKPDDWDKYLAGSGLSQLRDVVTLDYLLCPPILREIKAEYWPHIVNEDYMLHFFTDLDFMLNEVRDIPVKKNILCAYRNPESEPEPPDGRSWLFAGYDLVDIFGGNSVLTNCGGFPLAFSNAELSSFGLLPTLGRAREVQCALREKYSSESHGECHVWALYRSAA